ncbi:MAG: excinuclease ABC subunit A [Polaribacter sp.]|jgi:excinuclease ABC subunit A
MPTKNTTAFLEKKAKKALKNSIEIKGARANNLKNINITIPKNQLVVVTGVSGSGKSSITMDTLYAEGQRRYVESLSSYARQFLMRMKKPDVDYINGICPAIAIEQKVSTSNARSTVGSLTEIYDYLRLLFARIGKTYSPISGKIVKKHEVTDVVDFIQSKKEGTKIQLFIPLQRKYERTIQQEFDLLIQKGYTRVQYKKELVFMQDLIDAKDEILTKQIQDTKGNLILVLIDRLVVAKDDLENFQRTGDSVQTAFHESEGTCVVDVMGGKGQTFNNRFELDGMIFLEPTHQLFNYNNPYGACPKCEGYGRTMGIDENKVIPDHSKSVYEGAIACWRGEKSGMYLNQLLKNAHHFDFPVHNPYQDLSKKERKLLWTGNAHFEGIDDYFTELEAKTYKIQNRVMLARYRGRTICNNCDGGRLRPEASYVKIQKHSITDLVLTPVDELLELFNKLKLNDNDKTIAKRIILEITNRLTFMDKVGLGYLTLNRISSTLSGGETQRINLTRTLGSNLTSSMYILDEPSIGLHPKDTSKLVEVLKNLRDLGNTVIVVEHEEDIIKNADYLIDMGPQAGIHGGEVVYAGPFKDIYKKAEQSLTTLYMTEQMVIPVPERRRKFTRSIFIKGALQNNLKGIDVQFPLNNLIVVSGVSGSGKTTLVKQILYPAMLKFLGESYKTAPGIHDELSGDVKQITVVEMVSQSPIGKSSRSNPVTYVKAYDAIRKTMAEQQLSRIRGFKPGHFSFNVEGGRCEECKGEGEQVVEMQFLADVRLECEACKGERFRQEVLEVRFKDKNIFDILNLSVEEALDFFKDQKDIIQKIQPLFNVGLGYVKLGQSSSTLSGGEAQRVKLASFLGKERTKEHILFIFDEPTTGLHFHDIQKLLDALNALVEKGHSVIVVEHNMEVIKSADWLIDLGPVGGKNGGHLVFQGRPEDAIKVKESFTGQYLKEKL